MLDPVTDAAGLLEMQAAVEEVEVDRSVGEYCVALVHASRGHRDVLIGASPRGSLALMLCARALAVIAGRDYVLPEDVKAVAPAVLAHRITVKPELWMTDVSRAERGRRAARDACRRPAAREAVGRAGPTAHERLARHRSAGCGPPRSRHRSRWPRWRSDAPTCWCWPRRSAWCARWGSRTRRAPRSRARCAWPTAGCTRARAPGCRSAERAARTLEQVTATLAPPAFVVPQPPSGMVSTTPRAGEDLVVEFPVSPRRWGVRSAGHRACSPPRAPGAATAGDRSDCPRPRWSRCPRPARSPPGRARTRSG